MMEGQWFIWDQEPAAFMLLDGREVVGKPGDRILIGEDEDGNRAVLAIEPKLLH